jgi:hypothetical protein
MTTSLPTTFAADSKPLTPDTDSSIKELAARGFVILNGFTEYLAGAISQMAGQKHIREFCPNDPAKRFATKETTARWLSKGRCMFVLALDKDEDGWRAIGYGWTGSESSPDVPGGETTFAIRLGEEALGQKLSLPFARAIIAGSSALYDTKNVWLETWQSNAAAVHTYQKVGFQQVSQRQGRRKQPGGGTTPDTRLFMRLPE